MIEAKWSWIWPFVGATPVNQGLDTEMFDRTDYPYSETFVREAIQNSLDARLDSSSPVVISFTFHSAALENRAAFLQDAIEFRKKAGFAIPPEWQKGTVHWLAIEDFNAKGLGGDIRRRTSDFWNYWLNFGLSNKDGSGRGGRGIGRVTFLIASRIQTVIGFTRRSSDAQTAACGMCVLKPMEEGERFHSTHAYLAKAEDNSIYQLHEGADFHRGLEEVFNLTGYSRGPSASGLALIIPYPHIELTPDGIFASVIEHFSPAILGRTLVVKVNGKTLDENTIGDVAIEVAGRINSEAIREDVGRYISLIKACLFGEVTQLSISDLKSEFPALRGTAPIKKLQVAVERNEPVGIELVFPLERFGKIQSVSLRAAVAKAPPGKPPVDRLFREGMCLPDVRARAPGELDLLLLVDDPLLATYLNLCEGKAHLDLLESKEIKSKLDEAKFSGGSRVKRFVKNLPFELRTLLTPDIVDPDTSVFNAFFSIIDEKAGSEMGDGKKPTLPKPPPPPPPPPTTPALLVETLSDGFKIKANPKYSSWPVNVSIAIAYADGSRKPAWSELDFKPSDLEVMNHGCEVAFTKNVLQALNCGADFRVEIAGFDSKRELDTRIRVWKNAQTN